MQRSYKQATKAYQAKRSLKQQATPSSMKRLTLDIPHELHRVIKMSAAHEGVTMAEKLRSLLMEHYAAELSA
jgi:hypothetical protein